MTKIEAIAYRTKESTKTTIKVFTPSKNLTEARKVAYDLLKNNKVRKSVIDDERGYAEWYEVLLGVIAHNGNFVAYGELTRDMNRYMYREYSLTGTYLGVYTAHPNGTVTRYDHDKEQEKARKRFYAKQKKMKGRA